MPPLTLVRRVKELRALLDELCELTGAGKLWGIRVLDHHLELALDSPVSLARPANQLDFVDELAEAVWAAGELDFGGLRPGVGGAGRRRERLDGLRARLDAIVDELVEQAGDWNGGRPALR